MNCATARELLSAYVDGELPPPEATELAGHLTTCGSCSAETEAMVTTVRRVREGLVRHHAPDVLRARVRAAIREEHAPGTPAARPAWRLPWRTVAAGLLIAAASSALTVIATRAGASSAAGFGVGDEVVASHIRSLMPDHLTDVRSSDQHNVKPWFNGRVNVSPDVPRLDSLGYPLVGGRVDYIDGRNVASVVYKRRQHVINVFSWPSSDDRDLAPQVSSSHGYNLIHARRNGEEVWLASDLNLGELREFARLAFFGH